MNTAIVSALTATAPSTISVEVVDVTPELAQIWLGLNTSNRKLKMAQVAAFAADMKAGRWELNGEAIKLAGPSYKPSKLLDGQNRLHAVLKSGVTTKLLVVFGVPERSQSTMDSGSKRTVADNLQIAGFKNSRAVAAAATLALAHENGRLNSKNTRTTNAALEEYVYDHPDLMQAGEIGQTFYKRTDIAPSIIAYSYYRFAQIDKEAAFLFWQSASEKIGLVAGDPVIAMVNFFSDQRRAGKRLSPEVALSVVFRCWNARREDQPLKLIRVNSPSGGLIPIPLLK